MRSSLGLAQVNLILKLALNDSGRILVCHANRQRIHFQKFDIRSLHEYLKLLFHYPILRILYFEISLTLLHTWVCFGLLEH